MVRRELRKCKNLTNLAERYYAAMYTEVCTRNHANLVKSEVKSETNPVQLNIGQNFHKNTQGIKSSLKGRLSLRNQFGAK